MSPNPRVARGTTTSNTATPPVGPLGLAARGWEEQRREGMRVGYRVYMVGLPSVTRYPEGQHPYDHLPVVEYFSAARPIPGRLESGDLRRGPGAPQSVQDVLDIFTANNAENNGSRFVFGEPARPDYPNPGAGMFLDFHGGLGTGESFQVELDGTNNWFTDEAMNRGVGSWCVQRYYLPAQGSRERRMIGQFWITSLFRRRANRLELCVNKSPYGRQPTAQDAEASPVNSEWMPRT